MFLIEQLKHTYLSHISKWQVIADRTLV